MHRISKTFGKKCNLIVISMMLVTFLISACQPSVSELDTPVVSKESFQSPTMTNVNTDQAPMIVEATSTSVPPTLPTAIPSPPEVPVAGIENNRGDDLDMVDRLGGFWVRRNALNWMQIEPTQGARIWSEAANLEQDLIQISELGMQAILIMRGTPDWAQAIPGKTCGPIKEDAFDAYSMFLREAVERYRQPPYNVRYWEIGNEPDVDPSLVSEDSPFGCWGDLNDPNYYGGGNYAEMLKVTYEVIKEVDPQAQVLIGGLLMDCDPVRPPETSPGSGQYRYCTPSRYLEGIMENGGGDFFDGVSFHAYDYYNGSEGQFSNGNWYSSWNTTGPVIAAKARYIQSILAAYGYPEKYLINSENALLCGRSGNEPECQTEIYNLTKAYYIVQSTTMALAEGLKGNIWYDLRGWRGSALIDQNRQPLAAYQAYQIAIQKLDGLAYWGIIDTEAGISGYEFRKDGHVVWVIWSLDGSTHELALPDMTAAVYDLYGNLIPGLQTVQVSLAPQYIEWEAGQ